jgi:hypothetical protein
MGIVSAVQKTTQVIIRCTGQVIYNNDTNPSPTTNPLIDWIIILGALSPVLASFANN